MGSSYLIYLYMCVCRCCSLAEEVKSLREERARREGDSKERERELERLGNQLQEATKVYRGASNEWAPVIKELLSKGEGGSGRSTEDSPGVMCCSRR